MSHSKKIETQTESFDDKCWNEHYPKLQQYCRFLTQNAWDGDDIAQEMKLYQHERGSRLKKWHMIRNEIIL